MIDEIGEAVAEESKDVTREELDAGLAADLVHAQEDVLIRTVSYDDNVEFSVEVFLRLLGQVRRVRAHLHHRVEPL